jgi:thiamin pyrophosphokinase, vitamin B1 binding domain
LNKKQLSFGSSLCLSNRFTEECAKIEVFDGDGYVILSKE